jgi:hypothetical protein
VHRRTYAVAVKHLKDCLLAHLERAVRLASKVS